jgi:hypothetical protein
VRHLQGFRVSRLLNYEPEGWEFESLRARHFSLESDSCSENEQLVFLCFSDHSV